MKDGRFMKKKTFGQMTFIPGQNKARYPFCNSLFIDDDITAVIDPASDKTELTALAEKNPVDVIINTHYHEDHFTFNSFFPDADLFVHTEDAPCFQSLDQLMTAYGVISGPAAEYWRKLLVDSFNYEEREPARQLRDGDILDFGKTRLQVLHTPGHTPGHCSFYCEEKGLLYTGDLDLTSFGPWYGDAVSDIGQTISSINRLLEIPAQVYITSHDMGIVGGDISGLAATYLDIIYQREAKIMAYLDRPRTLDEIAAQWFIYQKPRHPEAFYMFGERGMVRKHLEYLMQQGRIVREGDHYCLTDQ